ITRSKRHFTPDNFLLKIESFSLLSKSGLEYNSDIFEAGGHKWRLSLYPKGIKKNIVNGHISLYLANTDTGVLPLGWEVNASFKLFVFDQIRDEYLTVQDAGGGAIRRFNDTNSEWGFAKFLPLDTFYDASQGYFVNNCCVFGAEVFVHERSVKRQCLSFIEEPYNNTLTWKIERFSTLDEEYYYSQEFIVGDSKWKLKVHPKGDSIVEKRAISVYLWLCDCLPTEQNVFAEYKLRIRDQIKGKHKEKRAEDWFPSSDGWGYPEFLLLKDLNNASKGFLVNDTVLVEAEIIVMSKLK
ncbi:MATH domain and coiled-coil domain-containing protein At3g58210, partial [Quercus suber]|uniref:MATH domain and coiled-coil domain-containing protein At3g58210 n=1 Tax=Quercus suber TaxID=58331 RepID=UPI0032DF0513